jgi:Ran GTPase-activating protein (RanGAP) involved in mRNA processing and transport
MSDDDISKLPKEVLQQVLAKGLSKTHRLVDRKFKTCHDDICSCMVIDGGPPPGFNFAAVAKKLPKLSKLVVGAGCETDLTPIVRNIAALTTLDLSRVTIPPESINLTGTLSVLPTTLKTLCLQHLDNQLSKAIAPSLGRLTGLQYLNLDGNDSDNEGVAALAEALVHVTGLRELHLRRNTIREEGVLALVPCFVMWSVLEVLDMSDNFIGSGGARILGQSLRPELKILRVGNNRIRADGATELLSRLTGLETLALNDNVLSVSGSVHPSCVSKNLEDLNMDCNSINSADFLRGMTKLKSLHLNCNFIGLNAILEMTCIQGLQKLYLQHNCVGPESAEILSRSFPKLKFLDLSYNFICYRGAVALAPALLLLEELVLQHNDIGDKGGVALSKALRGASQLRTLNVADNNIRQKGKEALRLSADHLPSLKLIV